MFQSQSPKSASVADLMRRVPTVAETALILPRAPEPPRPAA